MQLDLPEVAITQIRVRVFLDRSKMTLPYAASLQITPVEDVVLPEYSLRKYKYNDLILYGFEDQLKSDEFFVIAPMLIPNFFNEVPEDSLRRKTDIHGLFLISVGANDELAQNFGDDHGRGREGCPYRVLHGGSKDYFTFNKMMFYPFLMNDFTIGYYVCDDKCGSKSDNAWPPYSIHEVGIAVESPITYEATLGLYTTRSASIAF